jgi:hypothetical protein
VLKYTQVLLQSRLGIQIYVLWNKPTITYSAIYYILHKDICLLPNSIFFSDRNRISDYSVSAWVKIVRYSTEDLHINDIIIENCLIL